MFTIKKESRFSRFIEEYKSSLKPPETEELVNQFFNRPLAFITAKIFHRLKRSPNFVTLFSMLFGLVAGFLFFINSSVSNVAGAVMLELMVIFDCADGQLARMSGKSSKFGKTLDGLADMTTHFAIYYGVAFALIKATHSFLPLFSAVIAQLSMYLHIILYDHFKNVFIHVTKPDYVDKLETPEELREKIREAEKEYGKKSIKTLIARLYYYFYRIEYWAVGIAYAPPVKSFYDLYPDPSVIPDYVRKVYYREMKLSVRLWSFIGDTTHLSIFILLGLLNRINLIFPIIIFGTNAYMLFVIFYQRYKFKSLGLEREVLGRVEEI